MCSNVLLLRPRLLRLRVVSVLWRAYQLVVGVVDRIFRCGGASADTTPAPYSRNAAALLTIVGFCPCVVSHTRCVVLACLPTLSPPCLFPIVR